MSLRIEFFKIINGSVGFSWLFILFILFIIIIIVIINYGIISDPVGSIDSQNVFFFFSRMIIRCYREGYNRKKKNSPHVDAASGIVDATIAGKSSSILKEIFERCYTQNECNGNHRDLFAKRIYSRHPVE